MNGSRNCYTNRHKVGPRQVVTISHYDVFNRCVIYCHFNLEVYFFSIDFYTSRISQITKFFFLHIHLPITENEILKKNWNHAISSLQK